MKKPLLFYAAAPLFCIVCIGTLLNASTFTNFYDPLNRLTNVTYSDGSTESYTYDAAGNRRTRVIQGATTNLDKTAPTIFTNIGNASIGTNQILVSWNRGLDTGGSGLAGYNVYWNGILVGSTTTTNYALSNLVSGTMYCVSIAAFDRATNISARTPDVCFTTLGTTPTNVILLSDNFNNTSVSPRLWTYSGNTVIQSNGIMAVDTTIIDHGGNLQSQPFVIDSSNLITITRKVFLHRGNGTVDQHSVDFTIAGVPHFGITYCDYTAAGGQTEHHGVCLYRNAKSPISPSSVGDTSGDLPLQWDTWFDEKVTYNPASGVLSYFTNAIQSVDFYVGAAPQTNHFPTMALFFNSWGWGTEQQHHFDNLVVRQSMAGWQDFNLKSLDFGNQSCGISFDTILGKEYIVVASDDLTIPFIWTAVNTQPVIGTGATTNVVDGAPFPSGHRFYRLRQFP